MKITKRQLRRIIREECAALEVPAENHLDQGHLEPKGRDLGYGEGEGRMSKSQLHKVARYAQSLHDMILDDDDLPEWVQSKISVMASNIGKIKHYLEYKISRMD